ncbi:hypothetical protein ACVNF4_03960 [Streptomyces sp. S6]
MDGQGVAPVYPSPERARQVAAAWNGSKSAASWQAGYHPTGDWTRYPRGAENAALTLRTTALPTPSPASAHIKWPDGTSITRPLQPAATAYDFLNRYAGQGPQLTVTSVKLGEMTLPTTRGPATVPAWQFTVDGYDAPVARAASVPSELPPGPLPSRAAQWTASRLVTAQGSTVTVIVPHGTCDAGAGVKVLETPGSVVLTAYVRAPKSGPCRADLKMEPVRVRLAAPLGTRALLDASTALPIPYDLPKGASPSWS